MSSYTLSQATVFAETALVLSEFNEPLRPMILGGEAELRRYSAADEKSLIDLDAYVQASDTVYDWPARTAGAVVDLDYAQLYIDNALLRYYSDAIGSGDTIAPVGSYKNRIRAAATRFASGNGTTRSASLYDRDVAIGDTVYVSDGSNELWTTVANLVPEVTAASIAAASSGSGNATTQTVSSSITQTAGTANDVTESADVTRYDGLTSGYVDETYVITVIQAPTVAGDATTAVLRVASASGTDDQLTLTPSAYGVPTRVGTRGAEVTWDNTSNDFAVGQVWTLAIEQAFTAVTATSGGTYTGTSDLTYLVTITQGGYAGVSATLDDPTTQATVDPDYTVGGGALPAGNYYLRYTFTSGTGETLVGSSTSAQFTVASGDIPRATLPALPLGARGINVYLTQASGAATTARLYKRNVTGTTVDLALATYDGGVFASAPAQPTTNTATLTAAQISAVDLTGVDASGPTAVPFSAAAAVGTQGVTMSFSQNKLRKGDTYLVTATAAADGALQTLVLSDNLSTALLGASDLQLKLYLKRSMAVPSLRPGAEPDLNWEAAAEEITVYSDMMLEDPAWTVSGVVTPLPVEAGTLYMQYRAWLDRHAGQVYDISDTTTLVSTLGVNHPDNPLCYAVGKALANANGATVRYTAIANPATVSLWTDALPMLDRMFDVYGIVPLTRDSDVLTALAAHVEEQSGDENSSWRMLFVNPAVEASYVIVDATTTSDDATAMATLADNPSVTGMQYTLLTCTTGNAKFVTLGVRAGDTVRFLYGLDSAGESTWSEFTVASIINEDQLVLSSGHTVAVSVAQRFEVWRTRTKNEQATALAAAASGYASSRVVAVWPDLIEDGTLSVPGYFAAAAIAGLQGSVAPHQPLRNLQLTGFSGVSRSTSYFNNGQLRTLETAGYCTIDQESDGTVYLRRCRTTDQASVETGEESSVRSLDAIRFALYRRMRQYLGRSNVSESTEANIRVDLVSELENAKSGTLVSRLGSLVTGYTIDQIRRHTVFQDVYVVAITLSRPTILNDVQLVLSVTA